MRKKTKEKREFRVDCAKKILIIFRGENFKTPEKWVIGSGWLGRFNPLFFSFAKEREREKEEDVSQRGKVGVKKERENVCVCVCVRGEENVANFQAPANFSGGASGCY